MLLQESEVLLRVRRRLASTNAVRGQSCYIKGSGGGRGRPQAAGEDASAPFAAVRRPFAFPGRHNFAGPHPQPTRHIHDTLVEPLKSSLGMGRGLGARRQPPPPALAPPEGEQSVDIGRADGHASGGQGGLQGRSRRQWVAGAA